jgi:GNAT superfamily N-acetyltransferase
MRADESIRKVSILPFEDRYRQDFARLNREWLESFGLLEEADEKHLYFPRESIIERGGQIFIAVEDGAVVGTCAAILGAGPAVEIAKLVTVPVARRRGIGRLLAQTAIDYAKGIGAKKVVLVSNTKLKSALGLYASMGFLHQPLPAQTEYASADVYMELVLSTD